MTVRLPAGYRLQAFDAVESTMDEARSLAEAGAPDGTVVWAQEQTAGRGRRGRTFVSPRGNLYTTLLLRPKVGALDAARLGFVTSLALADAIEPLLAPPRPVQLKWPNDLLVGGAKISGILLESQSAPGGLDWLLIGIGVNVATAPQGLEYPATAVALDGAPPSPETVLERLWSAFAAWHKRLEQEGFDAIRSAWLARAAGVGGPITARLPSRTLSGIFRDLDSDGALVLEAPDGERHRITAADVFFG